nr:hypothetical protein [Tanacetum cinerariifolium]
AGQPPTAAGHHHTAAAGHHHLRPPAAAGKVFRRVFRPKPKTILITRSTRSTMSLAITRHLPSLSPPTAAATPAGASPFARFRPCSGDHHHPLLSRHPQRHATPPRQPPLHCHQPPTPPRLRHHLQNHAATTTVTTTNATPLFPPLPSPWRAVDGRLATTAAGLPAAKPPSWCRSDDGTATTAAPCGVGL